MTRVTAVTQKMDQDRAPVRRARGSACVDLTLDDAQQPSLEKGAALVEKGGASSSVLDLTELDAHLCCVRKRKRQHAAVFQEAVLLVRLWE